MSGPSPSKQDARPIAEKEKEKEEVCKVNEKIPSSAATEVNEEIPGAGHFSSSAAAAADADVDELNTLSGDKPFFDVVLSRSHVDYYHRLCVPSHMVPMLPRANVPIVLKHGDNEWRMTYNGLTERPRLDYSGWRNFVADNNLQCGDACIFEVMESSTTIVRLRVIILRNTDCLPPELLADIESHGKTPDRAIEID